MQLVGSSSSSVLARSMFVSKNEYQDFDKVKKKEIIDSLFLTEDKISIFLSQIKEQLPNLIYFKQRMSTDPLLLIDEQSFKPVVTVDQTNLYVKQTVANVVMMYNFIRNFFKSKLPTGQIPVISAALTDIVTTMKVKPISDELLKESVFPELVVYISYLFHKDSLTLDLVLKYFSQVETLTMVRSKKLEELVSVYKKENISNARKLMPRLEKLVGVENLHQRLVIKYGINDVIFMFDQPFYLYTTFNGSLNFKISPTLYQSVRQSIGRKIKSFVDIYTTG